MAREPIVVADAGPIIALAAIGKFELLRELATDVIVPRAVFAEVVAGAPSPGGQQSPPLPLGVRIVDGALELIEAFRPNG